MGLASIQTALPTAMIIGLFYFISGRIYRRCEVRDLSVICHMPTVKAPLGRPVRCRVGGFWGAWPHLFCFLQSVYSRRMGTLGIENTYTSVWMYQYKIITFSKISSWEAVCCCSEHGNSSFDDVPQGSPSCAHDGESRLWEGTFVGTGVKVLGSRGNECDLQRSQ